MRKLTIILAVVFSLSLLLGAIGVQAVDNDCWGQASAVYAQMGKMGEHASSYPTPRHGLRNLARELLGEDATMQDLGAFVAADLGLSIDACSKD